MAEKQLAENASRIRCGKCHAEFTAHGYGWIYPRYTKACHHGWPSVEGMINGAWVSVR